MTLLSRFLRYLSGSDDSSFWTISTSGRVVGALIRQHSEWRLSWFDNASPRLRNYCGPVSGDLAQLSDSLSTRLGASVSLDAMY